MSGAAWFIVGVVCWCVFATIFNLWFWRDDDKGDR